MKKVFKILGAAFLLAILLVPTASATNTATTMSDRTPHSQTSRRVSVRIDVEPNRVEHTSPERFEDVEKRFMRR